MEIKRRELRAFLLHVRFLGFSNTPFFLYFFYITLFFVFGLVINRAKSHLSKILEPKSPFFLEYFRLNETCAKPKHLGEPALEQGLSVEHSQLGENNLT